jgi:glycosyltransferase involved in cell wall biosynthesis
MNPFVVANPFRTSSDWHARALQKVGLLDKYLVGRKRLPEGIDPHLGRKLSYYFLPELMAAKVCRSSYVMETVRFGCSPLFDGWVKKHLTPGNNLLAGFGYVNKSLEWVKDHGGLAFVESRNSHPENFWKIITQEYAEWGFDCPPLPPFHHRRQMRSLELADYIFVPGRFIADSYISRGFPADRILHTPLPVNTELFKPPEEVRVNKKFTIVSTGQVSLRKGSPYLLEAFEAFNRKVPDSELKMVSGLADNMKPLLHERFAGIQNLTWLSSMPHPELVKLLQDADLFVLPSLEEGMLLAAAEAMAVGTPVILTPNMGSADFVKEEKNGSVVPIRDAAAIAEKMAFWHQKWCEDPVAYKQNVLPFIPDFSPEQFMNNFKAELRKVERIS